MFLLDAVHLSNINQNLRKDIGKNALYPDFFLVTSVAQAT